MMSIKLYTVESLDQARYDLTNITNDVIVTNPPASTRYYGMLVLDYMLQSLKQEFAQVTDILINVEDDHAALFTAIKLGYKNINYTGTSSDIYQLLNSLQPVEKTSQ
jgi:hypothetical protein